MRQATQESSALSRASIIYWQLAKFIMLEAGLIQSNSLLMCDDIEPCEVGEFGVPRGRQLQF